MAFSNLEIRIADAIVNIFETGKPFGDYAACAVLNDGAGISYGIKQFTHRSGSLYEVADLYVESGGVIGRDLLEDRLSSLKKTTKASISAMATDTKLKKALKAAAITSEMRRAQDSVAAQRYITPALEECTRLGFLLPLSFAVVCDSMIHGSWERFRDHLQRQRPDLRGEKEWITEYVRIRDRWLRSVPRLHNTVYRTEFFLKQIAVGRWHLELPLIVHGVRLDRSQFNFPETELSHFPAKTLPNMLPETYHQGRGPEIAAPAAEEVSEKKSGGVEENCLGKVERGVNAVAAKVDQAGRIVETAVTRTDKAKSLWTTVAGTIWQMAWAVGGFLAGIPREVWLVVAVIAGALMAFYLYRQIALGKIREERKHA